jgi:hypothetical protein
MIFLRDALANFLGALFAAFFIWVLITRFYEISRTKKATNELLAVSYALIKREIDDCSTFCRGHLNATISEISASGPITQAWETLHSTGAFRYFSPRLSEKLVKHYSLVFRLKANVEFAQILFATHGVPVAGASPLAGVLQRLHVLENGVCTQLLSADVEPQALLGHEISRLADKQQSIFKQAYEKHSSPVK